MTNRANLYQLPKLVTVFGGSGFVGRHVVEALTKRGYRVRVAVRRPTRAYYMTQLGEVGQIQMMAANVAMRESVARALVGADAAIFLSGLLCDCGKNTFDKVQLEGAKNVAQLCASAQIPLIHMSALTGDAPDKLDYVRTKRAGEREVLAAHPPSIILRPSVIFGSEDRFFNKFADLARFSYFLPLIGGGQTHLQPVYVGDVAEMVALGVDAKLVAGKIYELGGPDVLTLRQALEEMLRIIQRQRRFLSLPFCLAVPLGGILGLLGKLPLMPTLATAGQMRLLAYDSIVSSQAQEEGRTLAGAGIKPQAGSAILPSYLWRFRVQGQFATNTKTIQEGYSERM